MKPAGRIRVEIVRNGKEHEIIYNEATGEFLKDEYNVDSNGNDDDNSRGNAIMPNRTGTV